MRNRMQFRGIEWGNQRESPSVEIFQGSSCCRLALWREKQMFISQPRFLHAEGGIDSIAEGHWISDFRRSIWVHLQWNSENDDIPTHREVDDEGDRGNGPGRRNRRDEAGGAARATGSDKRSRRSG